MALLLICGAIGTSVDGADVLGGTVEVLVLVCTRETVLVLVVPVVFGAIFSA